ncbi:4-coumarate:coenzyme A ligase [Blastomyces dermatitidis ER-3]|uniref:4-coumarate:coenzyme A ligase n=1 Tax=Ajellomyces dermatitidis (strain ER-3 / ATCC MYA-2586) TaxID=559297 RepID=A0ABP2F1X1_AJEDR|nr:4-coumarate:coenzyme A ligase [Blastomyces dermatitidis ER-3]EEQ90719.2 4-coumarate:coenzyme A ligase [Blastomyces dermatitidis ER-3]
MTFRSRHPEIDVPTNITVWQWLFESPQFSVLHKYQPHELAGYTNAVTKERVNWVQVKEAATYASTALVRKYGMKEVDTISLFSQNTIWYPVAMFAGLRAGGKVAGASPAYNIEEMAYALTKAETKYLMTSPNSLKVAVAAAKVAGILREHIFLLEGNVEGFTTFKDLQEIGKGYGEQGQIPPYTIPASKTNKDICGFLNFSSGTTGLPKAVMLSHHNVMAQCLQMKAITPCEPKTFLGALPLFHITGLNRFCNSPIHQNDEVILLPQFTMELTLKSIVEYKITELILVPPIVIRFIQDKIVDQYDLSSIKRISCGAAPLSKEVVQLLAKRFPDAGFRQGYGMTESCGCLTSHSPKYYGYEYATTVGDLIPCTEIKIVDDQGKELGYNQPGEILAKGPQIAMGYLGNESATAESFGGDGFFHTGDIGSMNEEGLVTIVDRIKEMIKVKGIAVAPAELEDLLLGHPYVSDTAVLGKMDDYAGERPKAYVVLIPGVEKSEGVGRELMEYVRERKVRFKWVEEIEFTDAVPKSTSGKILRRVLKEQERNGVRGVVVRESEHEKERARL